MPIKLANNASGTLATAVSASDTGVALTTGDGAEFPALTAGDYFYATLTSTQGTQEIVKATARSGDSLTIVRAQESTIAQSFAAGARFELRVTVQSVLDAVGDVTASQVGVTPYSWIGATDAQAAFQEIVNDLAASSGSSLVGYLPAGTGAVATTVQAKLRESVSVKDFGAVGNGVADDTFAINAFFSYLAANNVASAQCYGTFLVSGKITFSGSAASTTRVDFAATFNSNFAAEDEIFLVQGIFALQFTGKLTINGSGGTTYASRSNGRGVVFNNCSRLEADYIEVSFVKYDAVRVIGSSTLTTIHYLKAWYCGGGAGTGATTKSFTFSAAANTGSSGSTSQRTDLTVVPGSVDYITADESLIKIGSTLHFVTAVNNATGSVTIFPWIENGVTSGSASAYVGAGYFGQGGDNSAVAIGTLDTLVCGIGVYNRALYPASISSHVAQNCGVGHIIGSNISSGSVAGFTRYSYYESNDFDIVQLTTFKVGYVFGATTALTTSKALKVAPRLTSGVFSPFFTFFNGLSIGINGLLHESRTFSASGGSPSTLDAQLKPASTPVYTQISNSGVINLLSDANNQRAFAINDLLIVVVGTAVGGRPTGSFTLTPEAGYSINGGAAGASASLTGFIGPTLVHAWLDGTNWKVQIVGGSILSNAVSYDPPSLADGAGATTTVTVTGAALGDFAEASFSRDLQGITFTAWVSAADTVSVRFQNETGGPLDLVTGDLRARVTKAS